MCFTDMGDSLSRLAIMGCVAMSRLGGVLALAWQVRFRC